MGNLSDGKGLIVYDFEAQQSGVKQADERQISMAKR